MKIFHVFFIVVHFYIVDAAPRPPYIAACYENDPNIDNCAENSARKAIPELVKGDTVYNIPKMNPMFIESIDLAPVSNLNLKMRNVTVKGLENTTPTKFHFNFTTKIITFELFLPFLDITGEYILSGSLLIFPIEGNGHANIRYINGTYVYTMHYNVIEKKNHRYMNTTKHYLTLDCERAYFKFDNLFNGNKLLAAQIVHLMDENWKEVNNDFGPLVAQAIDSIAYYTSNAILGRVPYEQIFFLH